MNKSESISKLAEALAKAQGQMKAAEKDKNNPFHKKKYADLSSIWDACREPLSKNGLSITQCIDLNEHGIVLVSTLMHTSGEWVESVAPLQPVKSDPQSLGGAITYMRRFSLSALVGIVAEDDDGNSASNREDSKRSYIPPVSAKPNKEEVKRPFIPPVTAQSKEPVPAYGDDDIPHYAR